MSTLAIAFVDGRAVPATMSLSQIHALLPQGVAGLRTASGEAVFPGESGSLHLVPQQHYTLNGDAVVADGSLAMHSPRPSHTRGGMGAPLQQSMMGLDGGGGSSSKRPRHEPIMTAALAGSPNFKSSSGAKLGLTSTAIPPCTPLDAVITNVAHPSFDVDDELDVDPAPVLRHRSVSLTRSFEPRQGKLILDRVHEHLMLPMIVFDIIDTPEFQRLRGLKQLGTTCFLYPGATHTRFEHSIGVAHLAGLMAKKIARRQPELNITDEDILCVTIAGLCHDLGHGPFSHLFESIVNRSRGSLLHPWHHESMSAQLVERILSRIDIAKYNLTEADIRFVTLCIHGLRQGAPWPSNVGRSSQKRFLVEIVSNKRSGIDVDKLDYFMRDSLCCYGRTAVDCHIPRLLAACKVLCFEDEYQICFEEKLALSLGDIFTLRAKLHKYAYQHRIVKVVDHMISDVLEAADPYFFVRGKHGQPKRISECCDDVDAFIQLGDWIIDAMAASTDERMSKAQAILQRIKERELYKVAGMAMFARHQHRTSAHLIKDELLSFIVDETVARRLEAALIVDFVKITYGSSDSEGNPDDPINNVTFYNPKSAGDRAFRLPRARQSPLFSPSEFGEKSVIVIVRDDELAPTAAVAFGKWRAMHTRSLGVEVPVYNLSPGRIGRPPKRMRSAGDPNSVEMTEALGKPVVLNLGSQDNNSPATGSVDSVGSPYDALSS